IARDPAADPDARDPAIATTLSIGGTLAGVATLIAASQLHQDDNIDAAVLGGVTFLTLGPSFGHWYSGRIVTWGLGARAAGLVGLTIGVSRMFACESWDGPGPCDKDKNAAAFGWGGAALFVGGTIYDLVTASSAAEDYNRDHGLTVAPT